MGRATQGVRLINLAKKNDVIASVCKVMSSELEASVEEESRSAFSQKSEEMKQDTSSPVNEDEAPIDEVDSTQVENPEEDNQ